MAAEGAGGKLQRVAERTGALPAGGTRAAGPRIGLVVDSACDLPQAFLQHHRIVVMPISIRCGGWEVVDVRDQAATLNFHAHRMADAADAETAALSPDAIRRLFLDQLVLDYDYVFCQTIASSRSPIYVNAVQASLQILSHYQPVRAAAGVPGLFALRVVDTQNLFAAQGLVAAATVRWIAQGLSPAAIRALLDDLIPNLYGYVLPGRLQHLRARARKKGDRSVGWLRYAVGSAMDLKPLIRGYRNQTGPVASLRGYEEGAERCFRYLAQRIRVGLKLPLVVLSYGGPLGTLRKLPGYGELERVAINHGVELLASVMSITGAINVGEGALAFALVAEPHDFSPC